ncbi:MAG: indole-3-glycerol phosphate synthase [Desulfotalea sp.]|nr:MAG: indole-3-glycerol phosphate synthase [Desulfotalea sp.]
MEHILDTIVASKKREVALLRNRGIHLPDLYQEARIDGPRGFRKALLQFEGVSVIAEVKKASPSKGVICANFKPVEIAQNYQENGAQAVSVLTDVGFFQGSLLYMMQVREAVALPVLRKDFIIDELQIKEAHLHGADAILLIAAILDQNQMQEYKHQATELGMDTLVEVHDEKETEKAIEAGSDLIGVNNRNLKDFSMDLETTFRLNNMIPDDIPVVSESGLKTEDDFSRLLGAGITAALVGESLMRAGSSSDLLKLLRR